MDKARLIARIEDNLRWAALNGDAAPPRPTWQQIRGLWRLPADEFVRQLYRLAVGRSPTAVEAGREKAALAAGASRVDVARRAVARAPAGSDTSWAAELHRLTPDGLWAGVLAVWTEPAVQFVNAVYDALLGRSADGAGLSHHLGFLADGGSRGELVRGLVGTPEYAGSGLDGGWAGRLDLLTPAGLRGRLRGLARAPADGFVRGLYDAVLHRDPGAGEVAVHAAALADGRADRAGVARSFLRSPEVGGRYAGPAWDAVADDLLPPPSAPSPPDPAGSSAPPPGADETDLLAVPDRHEFVRRAYRVVLGRDASPVEELRQVRRLRFLRFVYTRGRLLSRLAASWEAYVHRQQARRQSDEAARTAVAARFADVEWLFDRAAARDDLAARDARRAVEEATRENQFHRRQLDEVRHAVTAAHAQTAAEVRAASAAGAREADDLRARLAPLAGVTALVRGVADGQGRAVAAALGGLSRDVSGLSRDVSGLSRDVTGVSAEVAALATAVDKLPQLPAVSQVVVDAQERVAAAVGGLADLPGLARSLVDGQTRLAAAVGETRDLGVAGLQRGEAHAFAEKAWFEQLRWLGSATVDHLRAPLTPAALGRGPSPPGRCRVCGGELEFKWKLPVLHGRYEADYYECRACAALQVPDPHWLDEAYRGEDAPALWNLDVGRFVRNFTVYCYLKALIDAGLAAGGPRLLDFGGGYGLLVQMLLNGKVDAWMTDPYVARPFFAPGRLIPRSADLPARSFDLVTAFEVFEHLTDPVAVGEEFRRLLRPGGAVVLSTSIYTPGEHGPDWHYLTPEMGQHIQFWSRQSFRTFADRVGFRTVGYFPKGGFGIIVLTDRPGEELEHILGRAGAALAAGAYLDTVTRDWLLAPRDGLAAGDVEAAAGAGGGQS